MRAQRASSGEAELARNLFITRGSVVRIDDGRHGRLRVKHGVVWITQGNREDVVLQAGDSFRIAPAAITLISTCGFSTLFALMSIEHNVPDEPPPRARIAERLRSWWSELRLGMTPPSYL